MADRIVDADKRQKGDVVFRENRRSARVASEVAVEFAISDEAQHSFYTGFTEDISKGGVFLATHQLYAIGTHMTLMIELEGTKIPVEAVVRWTRDPSTFDDTELEPGMGLQFVNLSPEAQTAIEQFLKSHEAMFVDVDD